MRVAGKRRKTIAMVAGLVAVVALAVVLVLTDAPTNDESPGAAVLVMVDGEKITVEDVERAQLRMFYWGNVLRDKEEVLEELVSEKLLFREAEREGYVPTMAETEEELISRLWDMGVPVEYFRLTLEGDGFSYQEFLEDLQVQLAINDFLDDVIEVPGVTEEEVREFYEYHREYYMDVKPDEEPPPFEEMQEEVTAVLQDYRRGEAIYLFVMQLRAQADIVYM